MRTVGEFTVSEGERVPFSLVYSQSHLRLPPAHDPHTQFARTENYWLEWSARSKLEGRWGPADPPLADHAEGARLRADRRDRRGADHLVAGATRRHAQLGLPILLAARRHHHAARDDARRLLRRSARMARWLGRVMAGSPEQMQIMYGIAGERRLPEWEVDWLPGYENSKPVRIGNGAVDQLQLDVYGEVMNALHLARVGGLQADDTAWSIQRAMLESSRHGLAGTRRRHLGNARRPPAFHLLEGHGVGRVRPRDQIGGTVRAGRSARPLAQPARAPFTRKFARRAGTRR